MKIAKKITLFALLAVVLIAVFFIWKSSQKKPETASVCENPSLYYSAEELLPANINPSEVNNFNDCLRGGFETDKSFPSRICKTPDGESFTERLTPGFETALERTSIYVNNIKPFSQVSLPIVIEGEANKIWFEYGGFPVNLVSKKNNYYTVLLSGTACSNGAENGSGLIPFKAVISGTFTPMDGQYYVSMVNNDPKEIHERKIIVSVPVNVD